MTSEVAGSLKDQTPTSSLSSSSSSSSNLCAMSDNSSDKDRKVDPYGFLRSDDFDFNSYEEFMSSYLSTLARRASRWKSSYENTERLSRSRKLKRFCRKGIPGDLRPDVWMQVSKASKRMAAEPSKYRTLRGQRTDPAVTEAILLDIHRTFPENVYFSQLSDPNSLQKPLQHVLEAVSVSNPHIGYCQGMNFVAGLLLLIMKNEEKAFWLMDTLIQTILPGTEMPAAPELIAASDLLLTKTMFHLLKMALETGFPVSLRNMIKVEDFYAPDMIAIRAEQDLLGELIRWKLPDLHSHMQELGVQWCLVGMKWFICLFADVMPIETVLRIWDCMFMEGSKILLRVALTLVTQNKDALLKCTNFPQAVDVFKNIVNDPMTLECHSFMQSIFGVTGSMSSSKISSLRDQCVRQALKS